MTNISYNFLSRLLLIIFFCRVVSAISVPAYTEKNVSGMVVKIIQSYIGVVDKMVWRKY